jgi:hypothetical protein
VPSSQHSKNRLLPSEECNQKLKAVVIRCMQLELQAIQTKALPMCEMFEHICHIIGPGPECLPCHKIALSIVSNYLSLLKHIAFQNDFVCLLQDPQPTACPTLFEFDVHAGTTNYSGTLEIKRHLENLFSEPWSCYEARIERMHLTCTSRKPRRNF